MSTVPPVATGDKRGREELDLQAEIDARIKAPKGRCHHCAKHVRRKDDPTVQGAASLSCWSWKCLVCGAKKVRRVAEKFASKFLYGEGMPFVRPYQANEWGALGKRLRREGCEGLRVETDAEGNGIVVGLAPMPEEGVVPLANRVEAVNQLLDSLALMYSQLLAGKLASKGKSGRLQPLAGIGGWKLSDERAEETQWEVVRCLGRKFPDVEKVKDFLGQKGIESKTKTNVGRSNWFVKWKDTVDPFAPDVSEYCSLPALVWESNIRTEWYTPGGGKRAGMGLLRSRTIAGGCDQGRSRIEDGC